MNTAACRTVCWTPIWNKRLDGVGLELLLLTQRTADSVVLAIDDERGPFRLTYRLKWDDSWQLRDAELVLRPSAPRSSGCKRTARATGETATTGP